jgi:hypothetical protein
MTSSIICVCRIRPIVTKRDRSEALKTCSTEERETWIRESEREKGVGLT